MSTEQDLEKAPVTPDNAAGARAEEAAREGAAPVPGAPSPQESSPEEQASAPLTSLSSLFGGSIEGTSTCSVDGTCD